MTRNWRLAAKHGLLARSILTMGGSLLKVKGKKEDFCFSFGSMSSVNFSNSWLKNKEMKLKYERILSIISLAQI